MNSDNKIENFWTFIGKRLNAEAALADWRLMLSDKLDFDKMQRQYLAPTGKMARAIMCAEACNPSCGFRKVCEWEGKYEAVCREWPLKSYDIEKADALFFTVNPGGLLPEIAKIFKITPHIDEFNNENDTWKLGVVPVLGQKPATVYLTLKSWNHDIMELIFQLNSEERRPYILLVTARKVIHGTSEKVLNDMGSAFVPLDEVLDFNSNTEFELIRECSMSQLIAPPTLESEPEPDNIFRKCGDAWEVRFDGGEKFMLTSGNTGACYLHFMLTRRNVSIPVTEIMRKISGESQNYISASCIDMTELENSFSFQDLPIMGADNIADETAIRQYRQEAVLISAELEDAKNSGNTPMIEQLQKDLERINSAIYEAVAPKGQRKKLADQKKRLSDSFRSAVNFAIEKIAVHDIQLSRHLEKSIRYGQNPGYFSKTNIYWHI
jgi:hypothetical protein